MSQATQGGAASPQDVQSQIRGGPTAAQQAEGASRPASDQLASAEAALEATITPARRPNAWTPFRGWGAGGTPIRHNPVNAVTAKRFLRCGPGALLTLRC